MSENFDQNRRRFPRISFPCQLTVWRSDGAQQVFLASTHNIGAGGFCVRLDERVPVGAKLDVKIDFTNPSIPFKCKAIVVRSIELQYKTYEIGAEFDGLDEIKQTFLQGKISEIVAKDDHGS